jgi:ABC-2 type transport system ATP-binding protein
MMTGLLEPTEGSIIIGGHNLVSEPVVAKSTVGYIPDRAFFYEKLTVKEFLLFVASLYDVEKQEALPKIDNLIEDFGIKDFEHSLIEACSQGVKQRLLFAAALVHEPRLLIIDEPFVGLDPFGVSLVMDAIRGLAASGMAVFLATHSLHIAQKVCDRVGLIDKGTLVALKGREEIMRHDGGLETLFMKELGGKG